MAGLDIDELLAYMVSKRSSDLHLGVGRVPIIRVDGDLVFTDFPRIDPDSMETMCKHILTPKREYRLEEENEIDFAYTLPMVGRFRCNIYRQRGTLACALRHVLDVIPTFDELNLPLILEELSLEHRGIVMITGTTGSGKSTTLAAMLEYVNQRRPVHVITLEDPIEYLHKDKEAIINQREVGVDTDSFLNGIRGAMREDPDIILVGEMRDQETVTATMQAALTGHLVLTTLHTLDVVQTVNRIVDFYPTEMQKQARLMLSETVKSIISMRLLPMLGGGRIPAMEIMKATARIREFIENPEMTYSIKNAIEEGTAEGMATFDQYLLDMYRRGKVTYETALNAASSPHDFKLLERQSAEYGAERTAGRVEAYERITPTGEKAGI